MTDFLLLLGKLNLAMGAAIIAVWLLRRPLRALFGAPIAYALWLLVPVAGLASLLPPRTGAPPPAYLAPGQYPAAPVSVIRQIAHPALRIVEKLTGQGALVHPVIAARTAASIYEIPDFALLLVVGWAMGAVMMAIYLVRLQARFHAAARLGEAGPAVLGFFRPGLVMPDSFQEEFTAREQAAILAHERVHLARQDARINALAALLRCLCWFNPLVHLGAALLRIDQELACDATALAGPVSRRDYANALLKSQITKTALPLGCNWGSEHPLIERVALLKRKPPGTARRITGIGLVVVAAACAGLSAWAAQPAVPAKSISAPGNQIAMVRPLNPGINPAPSQNAGDIDQPVADLPPMDSGRHVAASKSVPVRKPISAAPAETPNTGSVETPAEPAAVSQPEMPQVPAHNDNQALAAVKDSAPGADAPAAEYPKPALKFNESQLWGWFTITEAKSYCEDAAAQTVTQGANRPMPVDDALKQRLSFFYWHCMQSTGELTPTAFKGPAFTGLGPASPGHPVNVSGSWTISPPSLQPDLDAMRAMRAAARSCTFGQSGNTISGTCTGPDGTGVVTGVIDGRQVRWAWKYPLDNGRQGEFDFLAMVGQDGAMTGQSINLEFNRPEAFTARPAQTQVASRK